MSAVRPQPCEACPYRRDVASGVWAHHEYEKLRDYDKPTFAQPPAVFGCHAAPGSLCHGWAVVHTSRGHEFDLLALRFQPTEVPPAAIPLFASGSEAADHGQRDIKRPKAKARATMTRLLSKHKRLRGAR